MRGCGGGLTLQLVGPWGVLLFAQKPECIFKELTTYQGIKRATVGIFSFRSTSLTLCFLKRA